jgi:hypothetical protein
MKTTQELLNRLLFCIILTPDFFNSVGLRAKPALVLILVQTDTSCDCRKHVGELYWFAMDNSISKVANILKNAEKIL